MNRDIYERRTEMVRLICKGAPLRPVVEDMTKKYQRSERAIYKDWKNRNQWMNQIVRADDPAFLNELIEGLKQIIPNAWYEYQRADNSAAKIGALRLAQDTYFKIIAVLKGPELTKFEGGIQPVVVKMWKPETEDDTTATARSAD